MIKSLTPHVEQSLNKFATQNLSPISHEKLLEKVPFILYGGDTMPLLHWKIVWWYIFPQYLHGSTDENLQHI